MRLLAAALLCTLLPLRAPAQELGSYLAMRIDDATLPSSDRVTDGDGTTYLVQFERLVLSLRSGNRFRASVRFRRSLNTADARSARTAQIQSMTVTGTYAVVGKEIRFTPDPSKEAQGVRMLAGTVDSGQRISVPFDYRNGSLQRRRVLKLQLRNDIL